MLWMYEYQLCSCWLLRSTRNCSNSKQESRKPGCILDAYHQVVLHYVETSIPPCKILLLISRNQKRCPLAIGVFKIIRNQNSNRKLDTRIEFLCTRTEIFIFFGLGTRIDNFSGYRFGYGSYSLTKWVPENPKFFLFFNFYS